MQESSPPTRLQSSASSNDRRLIERLSGWRLIAFFVSTGFNLGLLVALIGWPWILEGTALKLALVFVAGTHVVFLIAVAGFRFSVATKLAMGAVHATACVGALANLELSTGIQLAGDNLSTLLMIPLQTLVVTIGGVVVAQRTGFHRGRRFSTTDLLIVISAFAILFPILLRIVPAISWPDVSMTTYLAAVWMAVVSSWWGLVVVNLYLRVIPGSDLAGVPRMIAIGTVLLTAMVDWGTCMFGLLVGMWLLISLIPLSGIRAENSPLPDENSPPI